MASPKIAPSGAVTTRRSAAETRELILQAALRRFAAQSYEETSLRQIAADVGVDVALVHRSFGSKEQLFVAVNEAASQASDVLAVEQGALAASLARRLVERVDEEDEEVSLRSLSVLVRSLSSPQARPLLRDFIRRGFIDPLAARFEVDATERATLLAASLCGIAIFRHVLGVEVLSGEGAENCVPLMERAFAVLTGEGSPDQDSSAG